jgi:DNA polymerase V
MSSHTHATEIAPPAGARKLTPFDTTVLQPISPAAIDPRRHYRPLGGARVELGFPNPTDDFVDDTLDLNELLIRNEPATFFYRASGNSMILAGILDGDIVAVDRSVSPRDGDIVLAIFDGNVVCKILRVREDHLELHSANPHHKPLLFEPGAEVEVFAITAVVRQVIRGKR